MLLRLTHAGIAESRRALDAGVITGMWSPEEYADGCANLDTLERLDGGEDDEAIVERGLTFDLRALMDTLDGDDTA